MAINIHTDPQLERYLGWLAKQSHKTKTDVIKELVYERYRLKRSGFLFGALKPARKISPRKISRLLKEIDQDSDLD